MKLIDKSVLQDYGDFVDKLLVMYNEQGIPKEENGRYFFWEIFGLQFFIPHWLIVSFNIFAAVLGIAAFFFARSRRIILAKEDRIRLSGLKIFCMLVITVIFAHFGETVMQVFRGFRYQWVGHLDAYLFYSAVWMTAGFWLVLQITRKWKFSSDPYIYSKRFLIVCFIFLAAAASTGARLALYPAVTLFLLSIAVFSRNTVIKTITALAASLPLYRLLFHEELLYMTNIGALLGLYIDSFFDALQFNIIITGIGVLISLPLWNALAFLAAGSEKYRQLIKSFRKPPAGIAVVVIIIGFGIYLFTLPPANEIFPPQIRVNAEYKLPQKESSLEITGNEYFKDVKITSDSLTGFYSGRIHQLEYPGKFEAEWLDLNGYTKTVEGKLDTIIFNWAVISSRPWLKTRMTIRPDTSGIEEPESNLPFYHDENLLKYFWFGNYSDTLKVSGRFAVQPGAAVIRRVTARYADMPVEIDISSNLANVEYRTSIVYQDTLSSCHSDE
jgi:hypothetical protein